MRSVYITMFTPWKINGWNQKIQVCKNGFPFQFGDFRFHVHFHECKQPSQLILVMFHCHLLCWMKYTSANPKHGHGRIPTRTTRWTWDPLGHIQTKWCNLQHLQHQKPFSMAEIAIFWLKILRTTSHQPLPALQQPWAAVNGWEPEKSFLWKKAKLNCCRLPEIQFAPENRPSQKEQSYSNHPFSWANC